MSFPNFICKTYSVWEHWKNIGRTTFQIYCNNPKEITAFICSFQLLPFTNSHGAHIGLYPILYVRISTHTIGLPLLTSLLYHPVYYFTKSTNFLNRMWVMMNWSNTVWFCSRLVCQCISIVAIQSIKSKSRLS